MDSFIESNIKIRGGEILSHPSLDLKALVGISHEHIHQIKNHYRDISNEELQDFDFCIVFEAKNEESASELQELLQNVVNLWTSDEPSSRTVRTVQRTIAKSEDEEYHKNPKFFPKISRNGLQVITKFLPIKGFREVLQSAFSNVNERLSEEFSVKQEINIHVQAGKTLWEVASSTKQLPELLGSFVLDLSLHLSKPLLRGFSDYLDEKGRDLRDLGYMLSLLVLGNHANIDLKFEDLNSFEEPVMDYFLRELPFNNQLRGYIRAIEMRPKIKDFVSSVSQHTHGKFKLFVSSPLLAFSAELTGQDLLRDVVRIQDQPQE